MLVFVIFMHESNGLSLELASTSVSNVCVFFLLRMVCIRCTFSKLLDVGHTAHQFGMNILEKAIIFIMLNE